jgi:HEAT repeat protein
MRQLMLLSLCLLLAGGGARAADTEDKLVQDLLGIIKDAKSPTDVRSEAIRSLARLGPKAKAAVPDLIKVLEAPEDRKYAQSYVGPLHEAVDALGKIGPDARSAVTALVKVRAINYTQDRVGRAIDLILQAPAPVSPTVADLLHSLKDPDEGVRLMAAKSLGKHPGAAARILPALLRATRDPDPDVRRVAEASAKKLRDALGQGEEDVARLAQELRDPDESLRLRAAKRLGKLGSAARAAAPALADATKDPDEDVRRVAREALDKVKRKDGND